MGTLNKLLNLLIRFLFILVGLAAALVPTVYIFGHEPLVRQQWSSSLQRFSGRQAQAQLLASHSLANVYLRAQKGKLSWSDVNATLQLADYLTHQLQNDGVFVARRLLEFKKPAVDKKSKAAEPQTPELEESKAIVEAAPLQWLKDLLEPYLSFEHASLKNKHWIIVCLGELDSKAANEIESFLKKNQQYRVTLVSSWPITSKLVDITPIPYEGPAEPAIESTPGPAESLPEKVKGKQGKEGKESKAKKEGRVKVRQVKEVKVQNATKSQENSPEL